jgi:hypothetical protein
MSRKKLDEVAKEDVERGAFLHQTEVDDLDVHPCSPYTG